MRKLAICFGVVCSLMVFSGCRDKGELERAGERGDEIVDNLKDGDPVLHRKGPIEKAGEAIDDTVRGIARD